MTHPIAAIAAAGPGTIGSLSPSHKAQPGFLESVDKALRQVSAAQSASSHANHALLRGAPGASLENALVASAHARIDWNATVAVRNAVVSAYSTIMNMPV